MDVGQPRKKDAADYLLDIALVIVCAHVAMFVLKVFEWVGLLKV